jgi:hypothetical protein
MRLTHSAISLIPLKVKKEGTKGRNMCPLTDKNTTDPILPRKTPTNT